MVSRWSVMLASIGLAAGLLATATAAAAAPAPQHAARPGPARAVPASQLLRPGPQPSRPGAGLVRPGLLAGPTSGASTPLTGGPQVQAGTSSNWSGYAASGGTYTRVTASWVQPQVSCPGGNQYSSFWVGLDGFGNSNTVEQAGSEADCANGSPRYYAWYELYPAYPVNFSNPVRPGDRITGSVTADGGGRYTLVLSDTTRGWSHTVTGTASRGVNASAEVVAEAPSAGKRVLPLANFGTVTFTGADVNGSPLGSFSPAEITMVNKAGQDKDIISPISSGENFSATWQRRN